MKITNHIFLSVVALKSIRNFRLELRSSVRRFWDGLDSISDLIINVNDNIQRGYTRAFFQGAASCGIRRSEVTDIQRDILQSRINDQFPFVVDFANDIVDKTKANGEKLTPLLLRLELWVNQYEAVRNQATALICGDKKLEWVLGIAEHCKSCINLSGKVKLASFWNSSGILPRVAGATYLECRGFNCQCSLKRTDKPVSRGPLPALP